MLGLKLTGGRQACTRFVEGLGVFSHVINLGDTRSLVTYPSATTHSKLPSEVLKEVGISESFLRLSIGLEQPEDLIEDLDQALHKV